MASTVSPKWDAFMKPILSGLREEAEEAGDSKSQKECITTARKPCLPETTG